MTEPLGDVDREGGGAYPDGLYATAMRAPLAPSLDLISDGEVAHFNNLGYLAVEQGLSPEQVERALSGLETLVTDPRGADIQFERWAADRLESLDGPARLNAVRKFMWFVDHEPGLHTLAHDERLLSAVRKLAGAEEIGLFQDMALLKPPGGGREKPWHQDNAFFAIQPGSPIVGVWIALDEATVDNGCMHIIPGSHREGPVIHFRRRDWQICDTDVQTWRAVAAPLPAGGILFFHGLLHHGTPENHTNRPRRALQFHYVPSDVAHITQDERFAIFGSEGKDVTC